MSQETPIHSLGSGQGSLNDEDSRLVDSILNDLNTSQQASQQQMPQQHMQQQQMSAEEHKMMLAQRQQQMMQQQAMQQQAMQQHAMQQQAMMQQNDKPTSLLDKVQAEWKSILLVIILSVIINTGFVDGMFKMNENTYFILEDGSLNIQAVIIKALIIGIFFFFIKNSIES